MMYVLLLLGIVFSAQVVTAQKKPKLKDGLFEGDEFTPVENFTDEFKGSFDHDKWYDSNPRWKGRQPGLFSAKNVQQKRGKLFLKGVYEKAGSSAFDGAPDGYETYTTSFAMSKKNAKYGYYEVQAKPGNSRLSSAFWGSLDTPTKWTEIDVFEIGGGAEYQGIDFRRRINMNLHVFRDTKKGIEPGKNEISKPTYYTHSSFLRTKFNVYGLDWSKKWITWTFNGRAIRRDRNRKWKQAFPMKFDVETMPYWFGLPSKNTLPATYKIKYIRTWSRTTTSTSSDTVSIAARNTVLQPSTRQFIDMFGLIAQTPMSGPDDGDTDDDDEEDSAETEVFPQTEPQTNAPQDGLQRPPIPGSNEVVYRPVLPRFGGSWGGVIDHQNAVMDDILGAEIAPGEPINTADFDEELLLFPNSGLGSRPLSAPGSSNPNSPLPLPLAPAPAPVPPPAPAPAGQLHVPKRKPRKKIGLFSKLPLLF